MELSKIRRDIRVNERDYEVALSKLRVSPPAVRREWNLKSLARPCFLNLKSNVLENSRETKRDDAK